MTSHILDTNTILRFLLGDVSKQFEITSDLFKKIENKKIKGLISILVINETLWALEKYYEKTKQESVDTIKKILSLKKIEILEISKPEVIEIINNCLNLNIDFTDAYLLWIKNKEGYELSTFDKRILKNL
jgi:predicted nucleic acid-binding protein